jgi:hypothetical protein
LATFPTFAGARVAFFVRIVSSSNGGTITPGAFCGAFPGRRARIGTGIKKTPIKSAFLLCYNFLAAQMFNFKFGS